MVETTLNYLARMDEKPAYWLYPPPEGTPWRNTRGDRRSASIGDARALEPDLDREGFCLVRHATAVADLYDAEAVRGVYYKEVERLVLQATGAVRVLVFDHNVRNAERAAEERSGIQGPVLFAHNDYTLDSAPQRVRDLLPDEADTLLGRRFAVINVWKPISGPVRRNPLAFCDARSIAPRDLVATDLRYRDRTGEVYSLAWSPGHRWLHYPQMRADEVLLLKCYDSSPDVARFTAHTSFEDPGSPPDAPSRESIEVRTLAFWAG